MRTVAEVIYDAYRRPTMSDRLLEVGYSGGEFTVRFTPKNFRPVSEETLSHLRSANKEVLLAMRSVLFSFVRGAEPKEGQSPEAQDDVPANEERE